MLILWQPIVRSFVTKRALIEIRILVGNNMTEEFLGNDGIRNSPDFTITSVLLYTRFFGKHSYSSYKVLKYIRGSFGCNTFKVCLAVSRSCVFGNLSVLFRFPLV